MRSKTVEFPETLPAGPAADTGAARVFDEAFDFPLGAGAEKMLRADIKETGGRLEISVALPGVEKKDIRLDLTENTLAVSCERRLDRTEEEPGKYSLREQRYGRFYRSFALPATVRTGNAKAVCRDGVLYVTLHKRIEGGVKSSRLRVE